MAWLGPSISPGWWRSATNTRRTNSEVESVGRGIYGAKRVGFITNCILVSTTLPARRWANAFTSTSTNTRTIFVIIWKGVEIDVAVP